MKQHFGRGSLYLLFFCFAMLPVEGQFLNSLITKADSLSGLKEYATAAELYDAALKITVSAKDSNNTALIHNSLGNIFQEQGIYEKALSEYFTCLKIAEAIGNKLQASKVRRNIGSVYSVLKRYKEATEYVKNSYEISKDLKDSANTAIALNELGVIEYDQLNNNQALLYFQTILNDYDNQISKSLKASVLTNIASIYSVKGNYSRSLDFYESALHLQKMLMNEYQVALILNNMSILYVGNKKYKTALKVQVKGLALAKKIGAKKLIATAYLNLADIYDELGDSKKALTSAYDYIDTTNSIFEESNERYLLAEANYKKEKEEDRNKLLGQQNQLSSFQIREQRKTLEQRNLLVITILIIAILSIVSILLSYKAYRTRQRNKHILERERNILLENELIESELKALRAQMNPHFIFNALSSIKNYMLEQNVEMADYYLGKFAKLTRLILDNSSHNFVSLEKELQLLESYIQLEQLRFENKFSYQLHIDEEIDTAVTFIPSMIIQPFVENSIIHGFLHKDGECQLEIQIKYHETFIIIVVKDNGIGRLRAGMLKSTADISHQSKGYKICEERLKILSRNSNFNQGIVFKDLTGDEGETGTLVEINIPLLQYDKV